MPGADTVFDRISYRGASSGYLVEDGMASEDDLSAVSSENFCEWKRGRNGIFSAGTDNERKCFPSRCGMWNLCFWSATCSCGKHLSGSEGWTAPYHVCSAVWFSGWNGGAGASVSSVSVLYSMYIFPLQTGV